jgi:hypothetical protein
MRRLTDESGITIVELSIASFVLVLVSALMLTALMMASRTNAIVAEDTETLTTARIARERIDREVRQADAILITSDRDTLQLWIDEDNDDVTSGSELITWEFVDIDGLAGGKAELIRSTDAGMSSPQGSHYRSPLGTTYNPFQFSPALPATEQLVVTLIVEPERDGVPAAPVEIQSTISPRNLG